MSEDTPSTIAHLLLEDGTLFQGIACGAVGTTSGEVCFDTGMTGYQEILTNPSYAGQLVIMNNCYVGNYGVSGEDAESDGMKAGGLICKNFGETFSRHKANGSLQAYMESAGVVGISGIDTRALVRHLRDHGTMKGIISSAGLSKAQLLSVLEKTPAMKGAELAMSVSTDEAYELGEKDAIVRIAVLDLGIRKDFLNALVQRRAHVKVFPANTDCEGMERFTPDGYFLSSGPGDPEATEFVVDTIKEMEGTGKPLFGIGLGHQLLALAHGAKILKLQHGHRGINHPVIDLQTKRSEITSQNHGFAVDPASVDVDVLEITHQNLNDESIEGIRVVGKDAFSVQYYPESKDSAYLYERFIDNARRDKAERK